MSRYSNLSPLPIHKEFEIVMKLCEFFSVLKNEEITQKMSLPKEKEKTYPLSLFDFTKYQKKFENYDAFKDHNHILNIARKMEHSNYLAFAGTRGFTNGLEKCFYLSKEFSNLQKQGNFWVAEILGFNFLLERLKSITIQITGSDKKNGDTHCGTGILVNENIIITCAHVIDDMKLDEEQYIDNTKVKILETKSHKKIDVGYILVDGKFNLSSGLGVVPPAILDDILVTGFPKIPLSRDNQIVSQKGEINSFIKDFWGNNYFLFSSIARPGNSGGPVFSSKGYLVGIVSRLNEREGDNSLPFFSGIPAPDVVHAINELNNKIELFVENYE